MLRKLLPLAATLPMLACSATLQRPAVTTEAATALEQVTRSSGTEVDPSASPDGTSLAYEVAPSVGAPSHVEVMALGGPSGSTPRIEYSSRDATGVEPAWTPDGRSLVFVSGPGTLVQTIGRSPEATAFLAGVGNTMLPAAWPAVSPDGKMLAASLPNARHFESGWQTTERFNSALALFDIQGSGVTVLGPGTDPAWSPHGSRIAFARRVDGRSHIFVARADGSDPRQITDGPDEDELPSWSPDGRFIAFCSLQGAEHRAVQANLFAVQADGSDLVQLTEGDRMACRPAWAKDGFIYFHANFTGAYHIWRIRPTGSWLENRP